jgi:hypothetical protein
MSDPTKPAVETHKPEDDGNFLHVVIYAGIFLVIGLIVAFLIVNSVGRHILPSNRTAHPTSQLVSPEGNNVSIAAARTAESPFVLPQQII